MAAKRKTAKKQTKSKRPVGNKMKQIAKKKLAKKKTLQKKAAVTTKAVRKKAIGGKTVTALKKQVRDKSQSVDMVALPPEDRQSRSGAQSGDLQGLSSVQGADSESVEELIEEGNAFEADAVTGVEDAEKADEKEVRTHEVSEDDVPEEYLDRD